jgi:HJR/Mrr/RecB family endonuclease
MDIFLKELMLPLIGLLLLIILVKVFFKILIPSLIKDYFNKRKFKAGEKWRSNRELIKWLREMDPYEFEAYIAELFKKLGYRAEAVGGSHDGGIDVEIEKDGVKGYIQCKKYITSTVGVSEVRDFYGALADKIINGQAYFITTNKFTLEAVKFAEDKPIELVDSFGLIKYIEIAQKSNI